jgi:hypothetical protein
MRLGRDYDRRGIRAVSVHHIHHVAHLLLVLGVVQRLEIATVIDRLLPPHPAHVLSAGRGVEALGSRFWREIMPCTKIPRAPRPAYGHNQDGRADLQQVLLRLGVSGDGGIPLRLGVWDGNRWKTKGVSWKH